MIPTRLRLILLGVVALAGAAANASELPPIPERYRDTLDWTMPDLSTRQCTLIAGHDGTAVGDFACVSSSPVLLERGQDGRMSFQVELWAEKHASMPAPGGSDWPVELKDNGQPAWLRQEQNKLMVDLLPGRHVLTGYWTRMSGPLALDSQYGPAMLAGRLLVRQGERVLLDTPQTQAPKEGLERRRGDRRGCGFIEKSRTDRLW